MHNINSVVFSIDHNKFQSNKKESLQHILHIYTIQCVYSVHTYYVCEYNIYNYPIIIGTCIQYMCNTHKYYVHTCTNNTLYYTV